MNQVTIIGCDLHAQNMLLKIAVGTDQPEQMSFRNDVLGRPVTSLPFLAALPKLRGEAAQLARLAWYAAPSSSRRPL